MNTSKLLGSIFAMLFIVLPIVAVIIYFPYNFIAEAYGWPVIKSFWHAYFGIVILRVLRNLIVNSGKD